jgi:hypothetical protein
MNAPAMSPREALNLIVAANSASRLSPLWAETMARDLVAAHG